MMGLYEGAIKARTEAEFVADLAQRQAEGEAAAKARKAEERERELLR